jgi:hypothetical protein
LFDSKFITFKPRPHRRGFFSKNNIKSFDAGGANASKKNPVKNLGNTYMQVILRPQYFAVT